MDQVDLIRMTAAVTMQITMDHVYLVAYKMQQIVKFCPRKRTKCNGPMLTWQHLTKYLNLRTNMLK